MGMNITTGITLDGPRGPRRVAKPGAVILAGRTKSPMIPLVLAASTSWRMSSWDRLVIPKPFARIVCAYGDPIQPPLDDGEEEVERVRLVLERNLEVQQRTLEAELGNDAG